MITGLLLIMIDARSKVIETENKVKPYSISFTENKGQICDQFGKARQDILYNGTDGKLAFYLGENGISYQLVRIDSFKDVKDIRPKLNYTSVKKVTIYRIDCSWKNSNKNIKFLNEKELKSHSNFYLESCPSGITGVKSYGGVFLKNLYSGIDLHYYEKNNSLKCDYILAPGSNYKQIQIELKGASIIKMKNGSLLLKTPLGEIEEGEPIVYQGKNKIAAEWVINGNTLSFELGNYNKNLPLIIDPVTRVWGTFLGGTLADNGLAATTDPSGNVYMTGRSSSSGINIIATVGSHQTNYYSGTDAFLAKFDAAGVRLWGTYYGAGSNDDGLSCTTDAAGNVYMAGSTWGTAGTVIATPGSHQPASGGSTDGFLAKFNTNGVRIWSTYYGGTGYDDAYSTVTDASGNVYLAGTTASTGNAMWTTNGWTSFTGTSNGYLAKFNSAGVRQFGTCYGWSTEYGFSCAVDISGNIYLSGLTTSSTNIATPGSHQPNKSGNDDGYLVKFSPTCVRLWATYYGGALNDHMYSISTYSNTFVYVGGYTESSSGMAGGAGAHQFSNGGGASDGFLVKFNTNGVRQWGTFYGGGGTDVIANCTTDASGNVFATGISSSSNNAITTQNSHQSAYGGGANDAFLVKFSATGPRQWGTYYGGTGDDQGLCSSLDASGNIYLTGHTTSSGTTIATVGSHQSLNGGLADAFLAKFSTCITNLNISPSSSAICIGNSLTLTASGADTYTWLPGNNTNSILTLTPTLTNNYTLIGGALGCPNVTTSISIVVNSLPLITTNSGTTCMGQNFTITPTGALTYTYNGGSSVVTPTTNSTYTITGTDSNGCVSNPGAVSSITVVAPSVASNSGSICAGESFTINPSGAVTYTISGLSSVVSPTTTTSYTVVGTDVSGCINFIGSISTVTVNPLPVLTVNNGSICMGQTYTILPSGASTYTFSSGNALVTPTANTSYTINGTSPYGCISASQALCSVTVNPSPIISVNSGTICSGESFTLTPSGAITYTYFGGNAVVSPTASASYSVNGINSFGCYATNPAISNVTVLSTPYINAISNQSILCVGGSATLTGIGATNYTWSTGAIGSNEVVSPTVTVTYTVSSINANGCIGNAVITQSVDACAGINSHQQSNLQIRLFPNPNSGILQIGLNETARLIYYEIYNSIGQKLTLKTQHNTAIPIDLSEIANGLYFIRIFMQDDLNGVVTKFIKE